jgi:probable transposase
MRDTLYDGRPFRTLNIIDEGNREGLRIECGSSISSLRLVRVMQELVDWARDQGIRLMFIPPAVYMPRTFPAGVSTFGLSS